MLETIGDHWGTAYEALKQQTRHHTFGDILAISDDFGPILTDVHPFWSNVEAFLSMFLDVGQMLMYF